MIVQYAANKPLKHCLVILEEEFNMNMTLVWKLLDKNARMMSIYGVFLRRSDRPRMQLFPP